MRTKIIPVFTIFFLTLTASCNQDSDSSYRKVLSGKFVLDGSTCAGFNFLSSDTVTWTNEVHCHAPDTLAIQWIDNKTFVTKDISVLNEGCPPRNWIYRVDFFDGTELTLTHFWTGWNNHPPEIETYTKRMK